MILLQSAMMNHGRLLQLAGPRLRGLHLKQDVMLRRPKPGDV